MLSLYTPRCLDDMRAAIAAAEGNEVFFLGHCNKEGQVVEVEVLARGHKAAVPAIQSSCRYGDVVIHNHPSGRLEPSDADLMVAANLGDMGVGFHIIDNPVGHLYGVVEIFPPHERVPLVPEQIQALLGCDGEIAAALPGYEDRPQQLQMAQEVAAAFNLDRLSLIEAGTGTGKSLAYLVPALLWARANDERVVISTNTINLQEQLIRKDIPFLQRVIDEPFRAVLVKGRNNYLCLRRLDAARREPELFQSEAGAELQSLAEWAATTSEGSREELPFLPNREVWEEVRCEADQCGRVRCRHYSNCFFHRARRLAAQADLLVVNHALLLSDLSLRRATDNYTGAAVLPPFQRLIIDEAHHLEDVATNYFSSSVSRFGFARVLNRLRHPRRFELGLLPRLQAQLSRELPDSADELYQRLAEQIECLAERRQSLLDGAIAALEGIGLDLAGNFNFELGSGRELKERVLPALRNSGLWGEILERVRTLAEEVEELGKGLGTLLKACGELPEDVELRLQSPLTDLAGIRARLDALSEDLGLFISDQENLCIWFEVRRGRVGRGEAIITQLKTAPVEIGASLNQALYQHFNTVVLCSATLAVDNRCRYYAHRVGLDLAEPARLKELLLASPFDYQRQTRLLVPEGIAEPNQPGFPEQAKDLIETAVLAADGRSLVLFTAYSLLRRIHAELAPVLEARGYRCLCQGEEPRGKLLQRFRQDETSILFATDSFWEGIDVPGRALELVIMARLPFRVPTEPVLLARTEAIEAAGGNAFADYSVPQAVLRFKQGFGRLIRHRDDRGLVLILDRRLVSKGYGRRFLRSLPSVPLLALADQEVGGCIRNFLLQKDVPREVEDV